MRSAYAEQSTALLTWDGKTAIDPITVKAKQAQANWQTDSNNPKTKIADGLSAGIEVPAVVSPGSYSVSVDTSATATGGDPVITVTAAT